MIDYKELLRKYMDHVFALESSDYISSICITDVKFTDEEIEELKKL